MTKMTKYVKRNTMEADLCILRHLSPPAEIGKVNLNYSHYVYNVYVYVYVL